MLKLSHICKKLGNFALTDININIPAGEYFVLLGRSGSGKTQLLELIAGLNEADSGEIWLDNENITRKKIQDRNIGLVFQDYAIFPNMTVFGNIAYSLHCRNLSRKAIGGKVKIIAEELNISHLLNRFTMNLSGGELQRVALARTLITSPKLLLLDEPLASIDASLKDDIKRTLRQLNRKGLTIVHVTHDYGEAVSLATRVGVIHNGHIIQEGTPDIVFKKPVNKFVARYAGIKNFFRVKFFNENGKWKARCDGNLVFSLAKDNYPEEGLMILRNDAIKIQNGEPYKGNDNHFKGIIKEILPSETGMEVMVDAGEMFYIDISLDDFKKLNISDMSEVWISFPAEAGVVLGGNV
ncbi:MAG: ABC transporter ATP-binding protein [Bacteroidales bacterium]|jgi:ABC-type sugar transport system ATPase subunit|nr:ABC transporter ATP-binding protein [Bacteroidales bacterium]